MKKRSALILVSLSLILMAGVSASNAYETKQIVSEQVHTWQAESAVVASEPVDANVQAIASIDFEAPSVLTVIDYGKVPQVPTASALRDGYHERVLYSIRGPTVRDNSFEKGLLS